MSRRKRETGYETTVEFKTKRYLSEKIKEYKEFIEQSNEENAWNLTGTDANKEILMN